MGLPAAWTALGATAAAAWLLTPLGARILERVGAVDAPDPRRLHAVPTPRGGGIGIMVPWLLLTSLAGPLEGAWGVALAAVAVLALVGLWDDLRDPPAAWRFGAQAIVVVVALLALPPAPLALGSFELRGGAPWLLLGSLGVLWAVNLYNFMDGSNGLAAGQGLFGGVALGVLALDAGAARAALAAFGLAACCLGFLPWNVPRARLFMGDVGSIGLGGAFAFLSVLGALEGAWSLFTAALVMSLFLVDATATLLARMMAGERWYTPHRTHAYQRLIARGASHGQVAMGYFAVNVLAVFPVAWWSRDSASIQPLACIGMWAFLVVLWGLIRRS